MIRLLRFGIVGVILALRFAAAAPAAESPLFLISLDGFRWDYFDLYPAESAPLRELRLTGVSVRGLVPVFPSNTFPNHYTIVTGLYPAHHGVVNNDFFDPAAGRYFHYNQAAAVRDPHWWGGEPIWVTARKQGREAAASFWVGSEAAIDGVRPTFWKGYDPRLPFEARLAEVVTWMQLPPAQRPAVVAFYLEEVNGAGHRFGPEGPEVAAAVKLVSERVATLLARIRALGLEPNVVIVSDHGMTATSVQRTVVLDGIIDLKGVQIDAEGSTAALRPLDGDARALVRAFDHVAHVKAYLAEDLPARFHFGGNARIAPVWVLPEEGWLVGRQANVDRLKRNYPEKGFLAGDHGYDPALTSMRGILLAHGPAFRRGAELPEVENIHVYNLLCATLGLKPAKNDGDDRLARAALRE
jgi:predicted AlkP superfamily pyrophosphatase or phosphodiesterase